MFTIGGGTAQVLRTLLAAKMLGWKLPQTRDGYLEVDAASCVAPASLSYIKRQWRRFHLANLEVLLW